MQAEKQAHPPHEITPLPQPIQSDAPEFELDLMELFYRLLEKARYIILALLLGGLIAGLYSYFLVTPMYLSTAKLYVLSSNDSVVNLSDLQIGTYLTSDYQEVFKTWEVNERVKANLDLPYSYGELQGLVTVTNTANTRILNISVKSDDPEQAALIANEYAEVVRDYVAETMATDAPNILSTALPSSAPVSPNIQRNALLGAFAGAFIAIAIIVILFLLDDKIRSTDDIMKYAGLPTLAIIPITVGRDAPKGRNGARRSGSSKGGAR